MSINVSLIELKPTEVFDMNIPSDCDDLMKDINCYDIIYNPKVLGHVVTANTIVKKLEKALSTLNKQMKNENSETLKTFLIKYIRACYKNPRATVAIG